MKKNAAVMLFFLSVCALNAQSSGGFVHARRPESALEYYRLGTEFEQQERWHEAVEMFQESLQRNPASGDTWFSLASCSYQLDEYALALQYIENAQKYIKTGTEIPDLKGFCLIGLGRTDEARAVFSDVLVQYPNDIEARFGLAQLDIYEGRSSGAEQQYLDALRREPENKKALLSLALLAHASGRTPAVREYIEKALAAHSGEPAVYYFASYIAWQDGQLQEAEGKARAAIRLDSRYTPAYEMLALILYDAGRYQDSVSVCDMRIDMERSASSAWYLKARALEQLGNVPEALSAYQTGMEVAPDDELMRTSFEHLVLSRTDVEDARRAGWAAYHAQLAADAASRYYSGQAAFEYRRALSIHPLDAAVREAYAEMLLRDGYTESYLANLRFLQSKGLSTQYIDDNIESYESLLRNSLSAKWNIDPFYLQKARVSLGLYAVSGGKQQLHPDAEVCTVQLLDQYFSAVPYFSVSSETTPVRGYSDAFARARKAGLQYFALVSFSENARDLTIEVKMYSGRTGNEAFSCSIFRTGNGRYADAARKVVESIAAAVPVRACITARKNAIVLIDAGRRDNVAVGDVFTVVRKGRLIPADSGTNLLFKDEDVTGTVTVTAVNEDLAQGDLRQSGFYDLTNVGDELVLLKKAGDTDPAENEPDPLAGSTAAARRLPALLELIRNIR